MRHLIEARGSADPDAGIDGDDRACAAAASPAPARPSPAPTRPGSSTLPFSCSSILATGTDGTITPLFCSDGLPNPAALAYYEGHNDRGFNPAVLR